MIRLQIFNADSTHYWTEHFNSSAECERWLNEEKSRPYWKHDFKCVIEDLSNQGIVSQAQIDSNKAIMFLNATDWYVIRQIETGVEMPEEIKQQRAEARLKVIKE